MLTFGLRSPTPAPQRLSPFAGSALLPSAAFQRLLMFVFFKNDSECDLKAQRRLDAALKRFTRVFFKVCQRFEASLGSSSSSSPSPSVNGGTLLFGAGELDPLPVCQEINKIFVTFSRETQ